MSTVIRFDAHGGPERLRVDDEDPRVPGLGEILVANRFIGVNPSDVAWLAGSTPRSTPLPGVLGFEASGVVEAVGPHVRGVAVGDEVLWHGIGSQRTHAVVHRDNVRHKPPMVAFDQAAVLPVAGTAALSAIFQTGVRDSDVVLIHGASGAVGSAAVQIATFLGARVVGTASPINHDYVHYLGAEPLAHGPDLTARIGALPRGLSAIDVVVDPIGSAGTVEATRMLLGRRMTRDSLPRAVTTVATPASRAAGIADLRIRRGALDEVIALADSGLLHAEIARVYPLTDAVAALRHVARGHTRGRIVLSV